MTVQGEVGYRSFSNYNAVFLAQPGVVVKLVSLVHRTFRATGE